VSTKCKFRKQREFVGEFRCDSPAWLRGLAVLSGILSLLGSCSSSSSSPAAGRDATPGGGGAIGAGGKGGTTGTGGTTSTGGGSSGGASGTTSAGSGGTNDAARDLGGEDRRDAPVDAAVDATEIREAGGDVPVAGETGIALDASGLTAVAYGADPDSIFANPERGFYQVNEVQASSYQALSQAWLQNLRTQNAISLVFHMVYLDSFVGSELSQGFLDALAADFATLRKAGLKAVLRFAYTSNSTKPYGDASKTRVLGHIAQLKPVLFANSDVIAVMQAGFVGAWGEWYYTDFFGDNGAVSASQWTDRQEVVNALLDALDLGRPIQLRTPAFKQHFYGTLALTSAEAFTATAKARVGHHNDCFLASSDDMGTYANVTADKAYLAQENLYLPQGGETCATSTYSTWSNAQTDMNNLHWSFLNLAYHPDVLASWGTNIDIARRKLGYRLSLVSGAYAASVQAGSDFDVQVTIRNDGFAPPFAPRQLNFILRGASTSYVAKLPDDPRRFAPGVSTTVARKLCLPATAPEGAYALLLALPDPVPTLNKRPEYAIRLANQGTWEASTGYHNLNHSLAVTGAGANTACSADALTAVALP
jgi:hypothetical protein